MRVAVLALLMVALGAMPAVAAGFEPTFELPLPGDESESHRTALAGHTALVGNTRGGPGDEVWIVDVRSGERRATLECPNPDDDVDFSCGGAVAASRRLLAVAANDRVHLYRRNGQWRGQIEVAGPRGLATRGLRLLVVTLEDVQLFDARSGEVRQTFVDPEPAAGRSFGSGFALLGRNVVIGATGQVGTAGPGGRVYAFDARTGALRWTASHPDDPAGLTPAGRSFGFGLAVLGRDIVAGAYREGAYRLDGRTGELVTRYLDPDGASATGCCFGRSFGAGGGRVLIVDTAPGDHGAIYVFDRDGAPLETVEIPSGELFGDIQADGRYVIGATDGYDGDARLIGFSLER